MTAVTVIKCDGERNAERCRAYLPTRTHIAEFAHEEARAAGWTRMEDDDDVFETGDLCPSCTRGRARP